MTDNRDALDLSAEPTVEPAPTAPRPPKRVRAIVMRPALGLIGQLTVMSLFINALTLAAPVFSIQVYDRVVPHAGIETLKALALVVAAAVVFDFILRQARGRVVQTIALRVDVALSRAVFSRLSGMPLKRLEARGDAEWRAAIRDSDTVRDAVAGPLTLIAIDLPFAILFIAVIATVAAPVAWVLAAAAPVFLGLALLSSWLLTRSAQAEHEAAADKTALAGEIVAGRATAKALGLAPQLKGRFETAQAGVIESAFRRGARVDAFTHLGASLAMATTLLMTAVGAVAIIGQEMTIGGLIAANMLAARVIQPLTQLLTLWRSLERYRDAARRLDDLLDEPVERQKSAVSRPRPEGLLALDGVRFAHEDGARPIIDGLSATFRPGGLTGVFGDNGAGKTTLLNLMQGLYAPDRGRVTLDSVDIAQIGRHDLARWIGYVPQESFLFQGSIRDNIARGRGDVSDEAILAAASQAGVDAFAADLPDGYATDVGEGGRRFSPGFRQRIALARALLDNPPVLLLDEPSANLDFNAEKALSAELERLKAQRTIVIVSHARAMLERCDTLLALHGGRIALSGRAEDVLPARDAGRTPAPAAKGNDRPSHLREKRA